MNQDAANEAVVRGAIEAIWNNGELHRLPEFYREEFVSHQPAHGVPWRPGFEGLKRIVSGTRDRFPDYRETVEDAVAAGDRVVLRLTNRGTDRVTGRTFEVRDFMLVRMEQGRIAEQWGLVDLYSMYIQLGVVEPARLE